MQTNVKIITPENGFPRDTDIAEPLTVLQTGDPELDSNWRHRAMNEVMRRRTRSTDVTDQLAAIVRTMLPNVVITYFSHDRDLLDEFIQTKCDATRSLIQGRILAYDIDEDCAKSSFIGWHTSEWRGRPVEIVMPPFWRGQTVALLVSQDEATAEGFVRALSEFDGAGDCRCHRYSAGWERAPSLETEIRAASWDDIVLDEKLKSDIRDAVDGFFQHRQAYRSLGFAWKRGVLLVGPPGTGKTMVCKAVAASHPELPFLYVRDVDMYDGEEAIKSIFARARRLAPCIVALEDMDGFVNDGNRAKFLNELDGFQNNEGLLLIATSNHPENIDMALLRRPSRFDRVFQVGLPGKSERERYCLRVLSQPELVGRIAPDLDIARLAAKAAEKSSKFTLAYLKEALLSAALLQAQAGRELLGTEFGESVLQQIDELKKYLRKSRDPESLGSDSPLEAIGLRPR